MFFGNNNQAERKNFGDEVEGYFMGRSSANSKNYLIFKRILF